MSKQTEEILSVKDDKLLVEKALKYLERELRKICLSLLNEISSANIILELFEGIEGLFRPSGGHWNGFLIGLLKERRRIINKGEKQQKDLVKNCEKLAWAAEHMEEVVEIKDPDIPKILESMCGTNKKTFLKARELLAIHIVIRNRVYHNNIEDIAWWNNARKILTYIIKWYTETGIEDRFMNIQYGEPWLVQSKDGEFWCYTGMENRGSRSRVIYESLSGKIEMNSEKAGDIISAFGKVLGDEDIQDANLEKLMKKHAPEDIKGFILGGYIVGEKIGEGGFAEIFKGEQLSTGRKVALKILKSGLSEVDRERFLKEAEFLSMFEHDNIVKIYDHSEQHWRESNCYDLSQEKWFIDFKNSHGKILTYIVMERIEGYTLEDIYIKMKEGQWKCEEREIASWFLEASAALNVIHSAKLTHRDISPKNIMITVEKNIVKLMDFGISRTNYEERTNVTTNGILLGSVPYMAPEQIDSERAKTEVGPKSDIYSLGATFYELFTLTRFNDHNSDIVEASTKEKSGPSAPNLINKSLPWPISTILMGCLEDQLDDRYDSAEKLYNDLQNYFKNFPIEYKKPNLRRRMQLAYKRNRKTMNVAAVIIAVCMLVLVISTTLYINSLQAANMKLKDQIAATEMQKERANEKEKEAIKQTDIAQENEKEAIKQTDIAQENGKEAIKQTKIAQEKTKEAIEDERKAKEERDNVLKNQSLYLSDLSKQQLEKGDRVLANILALEALPKNLDNPERPYVIEAEAALRNAKASNNGGDFESITKMKHEDIVYSVALSPDGSKVVTASEDKTARIWDMISGKELAKLVGHDGYVYTAYFSPDGSKVLTASVDNTARIWDVATGKEIILLEGHENYVHTAEFSPDGSKVVTASSDGTARIWNARTGEELYRLKSRNDFIRFDHEEHLEVYSAKFSPDGSKVLYILGDGLAHVVDIDAKDWDTLSENVNDDTWTISAEFSPDGSKVVTGSSDDIARIWDVDGYILTRLEGHSGLVYSAEFSLDGDKIVTASEDTTVKIWDTYSGKELVKIAGHYDKVYIARFSPDTSKVFTASSDKTARVWDATTGKELTKLEVNDSYILTAEFNSDGTKMVTGAYDGSIIIWVVKTNKGLAQIGVLNEYLETAEFSPDGHKVVIASWREATKICDATSGKELVKLEDQNDGIYSAEFNSDGTKVVTASFDSKARIWDASTGKELVRLEGHSHPASSAKFSPDGSKVVTASGDHTARIWDSTTGEELVVMKNNNDGPGVETAEFSSDGSKVVTILGDGVARICDATTGKELATLGSSSSKAEFSSDSSKVVIASWKTVGIWDASTGKELVRLEGHSDYVSSAKFSPDGSKVVTASSDHTARIWDATTGKELARLNGHTSYVHSAEFSSDGSKIVTASSDHTARIWDVRTGKELTKLNGHTSYVDIAKFSPDGSKVLTLAGDNTVIIWPFEPLKEVMEMAQQSLNGRDFTTEERKEFFINN